MHSNITIVLLTVPAALKKLSSFDNNTSHYLILLFFKYFIYYITIIDFISLQKCIKS